MPLESGNKRIVKLALNFFALNVQITNRLLLDGTIVKGEIDFPPDSSSLKNNLNRSAADLSSGFFTNLRAIFGLLLCGRHKVLRVPR